MKPQQLYQNPEPAIGLGKATVIAIAVLSIFLVIFFLGIPSVIETMSK